MINEINSYEPKKQLKYVELKHKSSTPETLSTIDDEVYIEL